MILRQTAICGRSVSIPHQHAALPDLLAAVGLLSNFPGLAAALSKDGGIVAEGADNAQRKPALHNLQEAASFKIYVARRAPVFDTGCARAQEATRRR